MVETNNKTKKNIAFAALLVGVFLFFFFVFFIINPLHIQPNSLYNVGTSTTVVIAINTYNWNGCQLSGHNLNACITQAPASLNVKFRQTSPFGGSNQTESCTTTMQYINQPTLYSLTGASNVGLYIIGITPQGDQGYLDYPYQYNASLFENDSLPFQIAYCTIPIRVQLNPQTTTFGGILYITPPPGITNGYSYTLNVTVPAKGTAGAPSVTLLTIPLNVQQPGTSQQTSLTTTSTIYGASTTIPTTVYTSYSTTIAPTISTTIVPTTTILLPGQSSTSTIPPINGTPPIGGRINSTTILQVTPMNPVTTPTQSFLGIPILYWVVIAVIILVIVIVIAVFALHGKKRRK